MVNILNFEKITCLITFIPWILYYVEVMYYRIHTIERFNLNGKKYFNYINNNFFKSINIKELVLFFVFILFAGYQSKLALKILFPTIYLYLLVDFFHTYAEECGKIHNYILMALSVLLIGFIIVYYIITEDLYLSYSCMFTVSVFSAFIVYIFTFAIKNK